MNKFFRFVLGVLLLLIIPIFSLQASACLTETEFFRATQLFKSHSSQLTNKYHQGKLPLRVISLWKETIESYPAGAHIKPDSDGAWKISVAGWLARLSSATPDGMDFVMCHEFGHAVANLFWKPGYNIERIADQFAARICLRSIWGVAFTPARAKATLKFTWQARTIVNPSYDPTKCTLRMIAKAADGAPVDITECDHGGLER